MAWDNIISRAVWVIIQPSNFLILMMLAGFLLAKLSHKRTRARKYARRMISTSVITLTLAGFTNLSSWLLWPLEGRFSDYTNGRDQGPYSGIIVLAGSEDTAISTASNQASFKESGERLSETAKLARLFPDLPIIHSGGARDGDTGWSENDVAERFFLDAGINQTRLRLEAKSYNTSSNAIESANLIKPDETGTWFLVTSAFHMPRSVGAFKLTTINIQPVMKTIHNRNEPSCPPHTALTL